jgi:hypothetical protein
VIARGLLPRLLSALGDRSKETVLAHTNANKLSPQKLRWITIALPLLLTAIAAILQLRAGVSASGLALAMLAGLALGLLLDLLFKSLLTMLGQLAPRDERPTAARLAQLERDKRIVLRSLKDIEFDKSLGRVDEQTAKQISEPLRARAMRILRELDELRVGSAQHIGNGYGNGNGNGNGNDDIDAEIDAELAKRLAQNSREQASSDEEQGNA